MSALAQLGSALISVCHPTSLLFMVAGVAIGIVFGSIPGLSASMAVALMLPLTFSMEASLGMNTLVAVYIGGISGGLISAILLNMPGTASSIATTFDGYPMAQRGEAMRALGIGIVFSFLGSLFSFFVLSFFAPMLADVALKFTPVENFGICFFALTMVAILSSGKMVKGLLAGMLGLVFAMVGMAPIDGTPRFTFGSSELMAGFNQLSTLIGIFAVADILKGRSIGCDEFAMSVYPASTPIYMDLAKKGKLADMIAAGAVVKTAFCGPCFGAGDTPANGDLSIRHTTRNFPSREGSKLQQGQIASVALMDARSIAATAVNGGILTPADALDVQYKEEKYFFDESIYKNRTFDSHGQADPSVEVRFGPNIKDWPAMSPLPDNLILKVVSKIEDPVTTTDELIPSGETSSYRSNPLGLAEFTLSRKDPAYVGEAKKVQKAQKALESGEDPVAALSEIEGVWKKITEAFPDVTWDKAGVGSTIFAVKPGDGSAREQAASCQKVLGGWANIAHEYATKRYRSNLMNWGMLPLLVDASSIPFEKGDYVFLPDVRRALAGEKTAMTGYIVGEDGLKEIRFTTGAMTDTEREILLKGCLINYYRG